jgi:hypothetical protein
MGSRRGTDRRRRSGSRLLPNLRDEFGYDVSRAELSLQLLPNLRSEFGYEVHGADR